MTRSKLFSCVLALLFMTSCARIHYVGNSFAPTSEIEMIFEKSAIETPYEIIGFALGEGNSMGLVQKKLVKRAKSEGADAILIENLSLNNQVYVTNVAVTAPVSEGVNAAFPLFSTGTGNANRQIKASFIRYK